MARAAILVTLVGICASGCGTVSNLSNGCEPFGGVCHDAKEGTKCWESWCEPSGRCIPPAFDLISAGYLLAIDLPLSVVADTLTLPYTLVRQEKQDISPAWPKDLWKQLGQTVTLEGVARNAKLGAILEGEADSIWIDGVQQWPDSIPAGLGTGKRLRVVGVVIQRDDMPVFVQKLGEPPKAGIAVQLDQLDKAKRRFLLKDAKWTVLE